MGRQKSLFFTRWSGRPLRPKGSEGAGHAQIQWKSFPGRGNCQCEGPEVGVCLAALKSSPESSVTGTVTGTERGRREEGQMADVHGGPAVSQAQGRQQRTRQACPETSTVTRGSRGTEERQADTQTFQSPERPLKEITRESGWVHGAAEGTASDRGPEGL